MHTFIEHFKSENNIVVKNVAIYIYIYIYTKSMGEKDLFICDINYD